jgi:hypothetical protein
MATLSPKYRVMLERNLEHMIKKELDDPDFWGPKIQALSDRLGV